MTKRFATLDALRGVAAIGVMLTHTPGATQYVPGGYLAVDLFFALSGFVMSLSYQERLRAGMRLHKFMALRAARLWPMLFIGALLGVVLLHGSPRMIFLIPELGGHSELYPGNAVLWSLLMEVCAYLMFAAALVRLDARALAAVLAASGVALVAYSARGDAWINEFGTSWHAVSGGIARTAYAFTFGVLAYRLRDAQGLPKSTSKRAWLLPAAMCLPMWLVPVPGQLEGLVSMLFAMPAIVWCATKWEVPELAVAAVLSDVSYPLYCIHKPLVTTSLTASIPLYVLWPSLIAISFLLDRYWDKPLRNILRGLAERRLKGVTA